MLDVPEILKAKLGSIEVNQFLWKRDQSTAAIMIPLISENDEWHLLYTQRTNQVSTHQNEVSFPGGSYDPKDTSLIDTAFREVEEEIGIKKIQLSLIGAMPPIETITGFTVFPFISTLKWPVQLTINKFEVESIFTIPVDWLLNSENYYEEDYHSEVFGVRKVIHYRVYKGEHLWGFTAKITQQLLTFLQ
jgi:8-oxo-dGTP pyrophosphatase MutT (NUDIX family)